MSTNETDISPDSGEEIDEGGDIQAIGENLFVNQNWRILKLKNDIYRFFLVEFVNNKTTNRRKCITCETIVLGRNRGTSSMHSHLKFCRKNLSAGENQSTLERFSVKKRKGLPEVAKLVYSDNNPFCKVVGSATLQSFYRRLGFDKVTYDSSNGELDDSYHKIISKIKEVFSTRGRNDIISLSFDK